MLCAQVYAARVNFRSDRACIGRAEDFRL